MSDVIAVKIDTESDMIEISAPMDDNFTVVATAAMDDAKLAMDTVKQIVTTNE